MKAILTLTQQEKNKVLAIFRFENGEQTKITLVNLEDYDQERVQVLENILNGREEMEVNLESTGSLLVSPNQTTGIYKIKGTNFEVPVRMEGKQVA